MRRIYIAFVFSLFFMPQVLADHCTKANPAGGSIPVECVHPEQEKIEAPGPIESKLPSINQSEIDAITKMLDEAEKQKVTPVPQRR